MALLAPVLCLTFGAATSDAVRDDLRAAFRRPAALAAVDPSQDAVWALGRTLFFDTRLSASAKMSCSSCHQPGQWTDHLPKAVGETHRALAFRTPTLLNAGSLERYGWTGRFRDIEAVSSFAMTSPINMNLPTAALLERLRTDAAYAAAFRAAFADGEVSRPNIAAALTRYVRSITSDIAPFDRWLAGDATAIGPGAARGFALFTGKGRCAECHSGWTFTDGSFHDAGIAKDDELGRGALFKTSVKLQHAFKTPTLRNVASRPPYMHDGSLPTLEAVVAHYDAGGIDRASRAEPIRPLGLTPNEKDDLVAFLRTLDGGTRFAAAPAQD